MRTRTLLVSLLALALPLVASAQDLPIDEAVLVGEPPLEETLPNTVNCFDYYSFGSVQAHLTAPVTGTVSGSSITFSGTLENQNPYPIVDGALYVKVFRMRGAAKDANGPDVVDQFLVKGDITIPAKSSVPVSFAWKVPAYAKGGDYQVATFFTTSRKFNLLGLSFTDDVVGNTVPFKVSAEQSASVAFDKAGVTVDGAPFYFAAFPPRVSATSTVPVIAQVKNTSTSDERATISWTVYQWDAQLRENVVQEVPAVSITVPAGKSMPVSVDVTDTKYPVYLAVGTLSWKDTKSVINVRFVREDVDRTRLNFPGVMSYPLKVGQQETVFSCLHNAGASDVVDGGRLELTLSDMKGNPIHTYTYTGGISGAMMGVADAFTPTKDYASFVLDARLYQGDTFVDEAHLVYDCAALDPANCPAEEPEEGMFGLGGLSQGGIIGAGALIVLVALLVIVIAIRRMMNRAAPPAAGPAGQGF